MSKRRPGDQEGDTLPPGQFEDVDLSIPAKARQGAAYDQGVEAVAPADRHLEDARAELEHRLLVSVANEAMSAESGTDSYGFENIVGVGIGERIVGGRETGEVCVRVYVVHKAAHEEVHARALVPDSIHGVDTDVIATGEIHARPFRGRYRRAPGGVSIGHYQITAGTLGCLVHRGSHLFILSNNHVLANVNLGTIGDPIVQPGPYDGGTVPNDVIAVLSQFIPIVLGGTATNLVDCAIAQTKPSLVTPKNIVIGTIGKTPVACALNMLVKKTGRTTQFTRGRIVDCSATVKVGYGTAGVALFKRQIIIQSVMPPPSQFSAGGDSGSLIVADTAGNPPVGLLFAGSSTHTIANHIQPVLSSLGVSIV